MAKVGEGDPRWIVTGREDGKNVNNWHWYVINKNMSITHSTRHATYANTGVLREGW